MDESVTLVPVEVGEYVHRLDMWKLIDLHTGALAAVGLVILAVALKDTYARSPDTRARGMATTKAIAILAPLAGLASASYEVMIHFIAISNLGRTPPMEVMAPGFATAAVKLWCGAVLGVLAGLVALAGAVRRDP